MKAAFSKQSSSARTQAAAVAVMEQLDSRQLMSVSLNPATHVLTINGTAGNDNIYVDIVGDKVKVTGASPAASFFPKVQVSSIFVDGKAGNDNIQATSNVYQYMNIHGGDGNDRIGGGDAGDDLYGDAGNDTFDDSEGDDWMHGGLGVDTMDYSGRVSDLIVTLDNLANDGRASGEWDNVFNDVENVVGGSGNDKLTGNSFKNTLNGAGGNDTLQGYGGDDVLVGGAGDDTLDGGRLGYFPADDTGNDQLYGNDGNDTLYASDWGNNLLKGGNGNDSLYAYQGNDSLYGDAGNDYLSSGSGNDYLQGGAGSDKMYAGAGNDWIDAKDGNLFEIVDGGIGSDTAQIDEVFGFFYFSDTVSNVESFV